MTFPHAPLNPPTVLALDTSGQRFSVALLAGSDCLWSVAGDGLQVHEELAGLVSEGLNKYGAARSVSSCVIGSGPGSFTGLRVGYAFAKGFAHAKGIPLYNVSSLRGLAASFFIEHPTESVSRWISLAPAGKGELFFEAGSVCDRLPVTDSGPRIVSIEDVIRETGPQTVVVSASDLPLPAAVLGHTPQMPLACGIAAVARAEAGCSNEQASVPALSLLRPTYVRAVLAKTIEERKGLRSGEGL